MDNFFHVIRAGVNTTFQDRGRQNLNHIGIPISGAMDHRNFLLANKLTGNDLNNPVLEFAYQGPHLKYYGRKINIAITGDVNFKIKKDNKEIDGNCYETYEIDNDDEIDILSTNRSVYGYVSINGKFDVTYQWDSCSVNTKSLIGANKGKKLEKNQKIKTMMINNQIYKKKIKYTNTKIEKIRFIRGTNFDYFSNVAIKNFSENIFTVSKLSDRMGMRLNGPILENIKDNNIKSEGIVKGVVQVPGNGSPIIMLSDHGTVGGYPKLAVIISADHDRLAQSPPGTSIKFQEVNLSDAETLYKMYAMETQNLLHQLQ